MKKVLQALSFFLIAYVVISVGLLTLLVGKYYFVNIRTIEPAEYHPEINESYLRSGVTKDANNRVFYQRINNIGARNNFDVSGSNDNLIVLLGDSHFFGVGLRDDQTVSFFLNRLDGTFKYVNLARPGFNVCDSVARYFLKENQLKAPAMIIFEILLRNDIYASNDIQSELSARIEQDYRCVLFPLRRFFNKERLLRIYLSRVESKVHQDLSDKRFDEYIGRPLDTLIAKSSKEKTKVIIVSYDCPVGLKMYEERLRDRCAMRGIIFFTLTDLLGDADVEHSRLPDGHPTVAFNSLLADRIENEVRSLVSQ